MAKRIISPAVLLLSLVSLFTDVASEMLYPVMPVYLQSIGFSVALIGVLEGCAEAVTGISKGYFGNLSDQMGRRLPFVQLGYFLSALSKPMMAIFTYIGWIFSARTLDRLGKGIRTGARDALLSDEAAPETKGKVFGFHRAMDTLGAAIGPVLALLFLYFYPGEYKLLFILAFIPGITGVLITFFIKEKRKAAEPVQKVNYSFFRFFNYWKKSSLNYKLLVSGLLAFTFFNSSDVFLLLMIREQGYSDQMMIIIYIFYNLCYALFSYPFGYLGDRIGLKNTFILGLMFFISVYFGMTLNSGLISFFILFFVYGMYAAATEGISKALLSNVASKEDMATALGFYGSFNSIMAIGASSVAGFLWTFYSPQVCFYFSAIGVSFVLVYFMGFRNIGKLTRISQ
jgi:MFS family permease